MQSKIDSFSNFITSALGAVKGIVEACNEGENSINKRNNQLLVNVTFEIGTPQSKAGVSVQRKEDDKPVETAAKKLIKKKPVTKKTKKITTKKRATKKPIASKNHHD